ncbi:VOC family protein [Brevibacillus thermoruber]|uniref:Glyoxalase/bleomycin resistance/dioxygenase family protein n=1 Tax=Brevibacillus thermoruber TaxID=33942 RepID=A0A9X3Z2M7_9BACL|nr:glyoxalase/bleomycin resistance/dioxygenase family protein [Brevibacillus thermoruber]MDA5107941.1 glyoxalase/bleomycin resistance/dioxygenase family protein [Brevibacillus thermoruber]
MLFELSIVLIVIGFIFSTLFGGFDSFSSRTFVGNLLILAGSPEALEPFRATRFTCVVDSLDEYVTYFTQLGLSFIRQPKQVPTGKNMTVQHPDGTIVEYVEHTHA